MHFNSVYGQAAMLNNCINTMIYSCCPTFPCWGR